MKLKLFIALIACLFVFCGSDSIFAQSKKNLIAEVSFESPRNLIIIKADINGKGPFNVMLDTGTDPSAIDPDLAKELGLKLSKEGATVSGGGTEKNISYDTMFSTVKVGKLTAKDVAAATVDLSSIGKALGITLHGILGHSFLNNRIVQIDYPKKLVRFYSKSPFQEAGSKSTQPNRTRLNFRYNDSILIDGQIYVNGKKVTTLFDTGFNGYMNVLPASLSSLGLEEAFNQAQPKKAVGYNGAATSREGKIGVVKVGDFSIDSLTVIFWEKDTGHDTTNYGLTLGNGFLKDYVVTIDYIGKIIVLEKS